MTQVSCVKKLYHFSTVQGIKELEPRVSTHGKAWVYAIENPVTGMLFGVRQDDFDFMISNNENGIPVMEECYPGAFHFRYGERGCSMYTVSAETFLQGQTGWSPEWVSEETVPVLEECTIENLEQRLLLEAEEGNIIIHYYEESAEYKKRVSLHVADRILRFQLLSRPVLDERFERYYKNIIEGLKIDTYIFDMDGTLIDTEKYYRIFWPKALAKFGYEMTDGQALSMRSLGRPFAPARLKEMFGEELDYYAVRDCRKAMMEEYLDEHGIELKEGVLELLQNLKDRGVRVAIATATDEERTEKYLQKLGIRRYFDKIICATMVKEGKPSPDIYLYACEQLGRKPEECIAVEDAPNGVLAAHRAGCKVIMVPDQTQPDEELSRMLYAKVDSLEELILP